jgi:hypothetical protein
MGEKKPEYARQEQPFSRSGVSAAPAFGVFRGEMTAAVGKPAKRQKRPNVLESRLPPIDRCVPFRRLSSSFFAGVQPEKIRNIWKTP